MYPEPLMNALYELEDGYNKAASDPEFARELSAYQTEYAGRPTPLTFCKNMSRDLGFKVYLKREDLVHGGSHNSITRSVRRCWHSAWEKSA